MSEDFTWKDGERTIRFGDGVAGEVPPLLDSHGFSGFVLLTTERAAGNLPGLAELAEKVIHVQPGKVDELSAGLMSEVPEAAPLVALGGGRVIDVAKALAGARACRCAAIPTTLSGAEMTGIHRTPAGVEGARTMRPQLVLADPALMASAPLATLAATAMNAMAHAMEALYTPLRNPVTDVVALRAAAILSAGVLADPPARGELALGGILGGYCTDTAMVAFHHAVCQSIVRTAGAPHAETNAVMLPHSARLAVTRAPGAMAELARALGDPAGDPEAAAGALARVAARSGHTRLSTLGVTEEHLQPAAASAAGHPGTANTPDPPGEEELLGLVRAAL